MSNTFYAVQEISTGYFLPEPKSIGRSGYTSVEPTNKGIPRLHFSEKQAKDCLREWLKGVAGLEYNYDSDDGYSTHRYAYIDVEFKKHRKKENMRVVAINLEVLPNDED